MKLGVELLVDMCDIDGHLDSQVLNNMPKWHSDSVDLCCNFFIHCLYDWLLWPGSNHLPESTHCDVLESAFVVCILEQNTL